MRCVYVYSFQDDGTTYFGCLRKVFAPELDLGAFLDEAGRVRRSDSYGPILATRSPRVHCPVTVEQAYPAAGERCSNPSFFVGHPLSREHRD